MRPLAILSALLLTATPAIAQETRVFSDWTVTCDAALYCAAKAWVNPDGNGGGDYEFSVGRHATETYWELGFSTSATIGDANAPFTVSVDGEAQSFAGPEQVAAFGWANDFYLLGDGAQAVMDRLAPGSTLTVAFTDNNATPQQAEFSLAGLTASLIWIDEKQSRLGSERVAEAAPIGLDPVEPDIAPGTLPEKLLAQRNADGECYPIDSIVNGQDIESDLALDDSTKLYIIPCWDAAYNFGWKAYLEVFEGEYRLAAFPEFSPSRGWTAGTNLVNYDYDPATKRISTYYKGRGIGDCGTAGVWEWREYDFALVEFRAKEDCDGVGGDFPIVYSADTATQPAETPAETTEAPAKN